jgi:hypothetical protein
MTAITLEDNVNVADIDVFAAGGKRRSVRPNPEEG